MRHSILRWVVVAAPSTRRIRVEESGRVVAEIGNTRDADVDGKPVVYEPAIRDRKIVEWRCYVLEAPLKYFPGACRSGDAKEAR